MSELRTLKETFELAELDELNLAKVADNSNAVEYLDKKTEMAWVYFKMGASVGKAL